MGFTDAACMISRRELLTWMHTEPKEEQRGCSGRLPPELLLPMLQLHSRALTQHLRKRRRSETGNVPS